jgi:hypothetical protein
VKATTIWHGGNRFVAQVSEEIDGKAWMAVKFAVLAPVSF